MLFKQRFHPGLKDGSIALTFRAWSRPQVKAGGRYRLDADTALHVDTLDVVSIASISGPDARRAGFAGRDELLAELRRSSRTPLTARSAVYRVAFHAVAQPDERRTVASHARLSAPDLRELAARLQRLDARSSHGAWTQRTLSLIAANPAVPASQLAKRLGRETKAFKSDVRKLKALGLTISLERSYRLSPRGEAFLRRAS